MIQFHDFFFGIGIGIIGKCIYLGYNILGLVQVIR